MKKGEEQRAIRRALNNFDKWIQLTGAIKTGTSTCYEIESIIEDAVHCGIQAALNICEPLPSQKESPE
jgi:hypothetical protein